MYDPDAYNDDIPVKVWAEDGFKYHRYLMIGMGVLVAAALAAFTLF